MGMSLEEAVTKLPRSREQRVRENPRKYPLEWERKAVANGIPKHIFCRRCGDGWTFKDASSVPVMEKGQTRKLLGIEVKI
jgi:hypothetical protein